MEQVFFYQYSSSISEVFISYPSRILFHIVLLTSSISEVFPQLILQEFEHFLRSHKQWWCHFDDDNYVNVAALLDTLEQYEAGKPWYLGKTSTASPLKIVHPKGGSVRPSL